MTDPTVEPICVETPNQNRFLDPLSASKRRIQAMLTLA